MRAVTSGACTPSTTSARTVIAGKPSRRQTMPSSKVGFEVGDLAQRDEALVFRVDIQVGQAPQAAALLLAGAQHHIDRLIAFPVLRDGQPIQERVEIAREILRVDPQHPRLVLIHSQP